MGTYSVASTVIVIVCVNHVSLERCEHEFCWEVLPVISDMFHETERETLRENYVLVLIKKL